MKISIVIPSFYPALIYGGTIFASLNNAKLLAQNGHHVFVSTTNSNKKNKLDVSTGKFIEIEKNIFVKYYNETIVDKLSVSLLLNIRNDIKNADLVHVQAIFNTPIPISLFFAKQLKKPVLLSPHGVLGNWVMNNGSSLKRLWLNLLIKPFASYVNWLATSEQEKKEIISHFPVANVFVIPNPIDLKEFGYSNKLSRADFLNKFVNLSDNPDKIVVSMGRLQKKKGFDILIKAFKKVISKYPKAFLFIAGEDEGEKDSLIKLIRNLGLENKVFFTGNLTGQDKVDFLSNADLFVLPSHNENFGIVYAESLAAGTPIIASKDTPWEEVEKFNCGKWINNTVLENEQAILDMLENNDPQIRRNAKEYVQKFSFEIGAIELAKVFKLISTKNV